MRSLLLLFLFAMLGIFLIEYCESKRAPDELGMHANYSVICENGFKYKVLSNRQGTILMLNSDGTPVKCDQKQY